MKKLQVFYEGWGERWHWPPWQMMADTCCLNTALRHFNKAWSFRPGTWSSEPKPTAVFRNTRCAYLAWWPMPCPMAGG